MEIKIDGITLTPPEHVQLILSPEDFKAIKVALATAAVYEAQHGNPVYSSSLLALGKRVDQSVVSS